MFSLVSRKFLAMRNIVLYSVFVLTFGCDYYCIQQSRSKVRTNMLWKWSTGQSFTFPKWLCYKIGTLDGIRNITLRLVICSGSGNYIEKMVTFENHCITEGNLSCNEEHCHTKMFQLTAQLACANHEISYLESLLSKANELTG